MSIDVSTKFVVLTTNRSGSVWVMSALNSFQNVTAQGELFLPRKRATEKRWDSDFAVSRFIETKHEGLAFRPFTVFSYLNMLYSSPGAIGFKLMYAQLGKYPEILAYLIKHNIRIVHLVRRNHLDVLVSYAVKAKIGRAHILEGQSSPENIRINLDTKNLNNQLKRLQMKQQLARKILRWFRLTHLEVAYEDLHRDKSHFNTIFDFLSIESQEDVPQSALIKINKGHHREIITNYDDVRKTLFNSEFSEMIH